MISLAWIAPRRSAVRIRLAPSAQGTEAVAGTPPRSAECGEEPGIVGAFGPGGGENCLALLALASFQQVPAEQLPSQIGFPAAVLERAALRPDGKLEIPRVGRNLGETVIALAQLKVRRPLHRGDPAEGILGLFEVFSRFEDREQLGEARHAES
jgi:hypothetical protein